VLSALSTVPDWIRDGEHIERSLAFSDFAAAFGFMTSVAIISEAMDHHPDWSNSYNRVHVRLSTHDIGALSDSDFVLARRMDQIFGSAHGAVSDA